MSEAERLAARADRLDELADTAELMNDDDNAFGLRERSSELRLKAIALIPPFRPEPDGSGKSAC